MTPGAPSDPARSEGTFRSRVKDVCYRFWPVSSSFLFLLVALSTALILTRHVTGGAVSSPACNCPATTVGKLQWREWIGTVSAGLALAILLGVHGVVRLRRLPVQLPEATGISRKMMRIHGWMALLWVVFLAATVSLLVHDPRQWPMSMTWRLLLVSTTGIVCAAPWVAITWLCHQATRPYWSAAVARTQHGHSSMSTPNERIAALQQIWSQIVSVALAFAGLVAVSMIPTGALRNLWLSQNVSGTAATQRLGDSFPPSEVLVYGATWAFVASLVVIPLVFSWRTAAQSVVDAVYPPNASTARDPDSVTARASLEAMLNVSSGILRNPLTVLTVLTPLATAALAAFVPEIGK